ncbi:MAG TPA: glycosyltransferase family 39 protein, partial [Bacteroidota bacterium]
VKIFIEENPKLWLWFGVVAGLGLLNKYSVGFLCVALVVALLLTPSRKHLATKWFWIGALTAFVLFLPHLVWEIRNGVPSIEFMRNASQQKNVPTPLLEFLLGQFREGNFFNAPIWLFGLYFFFFHPDTRRVRFLGWLYVILFAIFTVGNGKAYYLSPVYPVLLAGGSVFLERSWQHRPLRWMRVAYPCLMIALSVIVLPLALPVLPVERLIEYQNVLGLTPKSEERTSVGTLPQGYADEFGWEEFAATAAKIYQTLTPEEQTQCVIFVRNYGEAAAIDFFGKKYGLPDALCAHNSYWYWGPGEKTGDIAIILGSRRDLQANLDDLQRAYKSVEPSLRTECSLCMPYENGRQFFVCRGMNTTFQKIWPGERFVI